MGHLRPSGAELIASESQTIQINIQAAPYVHLTID